MTYLMFLLGITALVVGAEGFVRGASATGRRMGLSPLVIGLTIVAFGTSAPELGVSIAAAFQGNTSVTLGNVVGSNIFNILTILGLSALVAPLAIGPSILTRDTPIMIAASVLVLAVGWDGAVTRVEGGALFLGLLAYLAYQYVRSRSTDATAPLEKPTFVRPWWLDILYVVVGLGLLVLGSSWLVDSSVAMARYFGVSDLVIGLTIVAAGTSLPEVATSVMASIRGEREIAVGNVVGSNIFNILGVLGITCAISPAPIEVATSALRFDIPVMIAVAAVCLPIFWSWGRITRWEGALLLLGYLAYTVYVVLVATRSSQAYVLGTGLTLVGVPALCVILAGSMFRYRRARLLARPS